MATLSQCTISNSFSLVYGIASGGWLNLNRLSVASRSTLEATSNPWSYNVQYDVARTTVVDKDGKGQFTSVQQAINSVPSNNPTWVKIRINYGIYTDNPWSYSLQDVVARSIVVDKNGKGQFTTVKEAIDSVPLNNQAWIKIHVNYGIYIEQVQIPREKPYIILEGDLNPRPEIQFNANGSVVTSPTFQALADNFVARNIVFKNTYDKLERPNGKQTTQAVALTLAGDKQSLYNCRLQSLQDTLSDAKGRHYFNGCTIEGAVDFIWSMGQSLYENCEIVSLSDKLGFGYITANGREGPNDPSAFVFKDCKITGSGPIYLGRPYRQYSRVLFYRTFMEKIVVPAGWESKIGGVKVPVAHVSFSEVNCSGPGADTSRRVAWMKKLSAQEVMSLTTAATFIDQDGWIGKQPK